MPRISRRRSREAVAEPVRRGLGNAGKRRTRTDRFLGFAAALVLASSVAGVVAARSGSDGTKPAPTVATGPPLPADYYAATDAAVCGLLDRSDLEATMGVAYPDGDNPGITNTFGDIPGITKCRYRPTAYPRLKVETAVFAGNAAATFEETKMSRNAFKAEVVPGLGQEALWYPQGNELLVLNKEKILGLAVGIGATGDSDADQKERARRLAVKALARLR